MLLDAHETARRLPWRELVAQVRAVLLDPSVAVPQRTVLPLAGGSSLILMPAADARVAMAKLITYTPGNAGTPRPAIQGDVAVFDVATGERRLVLDGPTVTARRTAAVSVLAAQLLAPQPKGPLLIVGAGAQGRSHAQAFIEVLGVRDVRVVSRSASNARALVDCARSLGADARVVDDADEAMRDCPLVVTCTPANAVVLHALPRSDAFIAAIGAFTPAMVELSPQVCIHCAQAGRVVVDTPDAVHEAGDLLQAGLDVGALPTLRDLLAAPGAPRGPALFKSCGWAGWDLAAARVSLAQP